MKSGTEEPFPADAAIRARVAGELDAHFLPMQLTPEQKVMVACRILAQHGHAGTLAGQVTLREAGGSNWLTTEFGTGLDEATCGNLVRFDDELVPLTGRGLPNPAVRFHLWIYRKRPEVCAIVHTHALYTSALSMLGEPLAVAHMDATMLYNDCAWLPEWPGVPIADEEGRIISEALADRSAILLAHHGLLTVGTTLERATYLAVSMEHAARLQLLARGFGQIREIPDHHARDAHAFMNKDAIVNATFNYWARQVMRECPELSFVGVP